MSKLTTAWRNWLSLFRYEKDIDRPHLSIYWMTPYWFVRILWYYCPREFKGWPHSYDSGIILGLRFPFQKTFMERQFFRHEVQMPLQMYKAMDSVYVARSVKELEWADERGRLTPQQSKDSQYIAATIRAMSVMLPICPHNYWTADCPGCARRALTLAVQLTAKHLPASVPDPREDPFTAFKRRQAEAEKQLGVSIPSFAPPTDNEPSTP